MRRIRVNGVDLHLEHAVYQGKKTVYFYVLNEMKAKRYLLSVDERGERIEPKDRRMFNFPEQVTGMADALGNLPFEKLLIQAGAT